MRITNSLIYDQSLRDLTASNDRYMTTQRKIAENTDIVTSSDDPVGAGQVMRYEAVNLLLDQYADNAIAAQNSLDYEEVVLDGLTQLLDRATTLLIQVENGAYAKGEYESVSDELEMLKLSAADLMNTTDSDGKFIFAGSDSRKTAFHLRPDGEYVFIGDEDRKRIQVSDNVAMAAADSGKTVFQDVWTRYNYDFSQILAEGEEPVLFRTEVHDQDDFDVFMLDNYDAVASEKNTFTLNYTPGEPSVPRVPGTPRVPAVPGTPAIPAVLEVPATEISSVIPGTLEIPAVLGIPEILAVAAIPAVPATPGYFSITNSTGDIIEEGEYMDGRPLNVLGMQIDFDSSDPVTAEITLRQPERDNVLNQLTDVINALRNEDLGYYDIESELRDATVSIRNTQSSINGTRTELGANLNTLQRIATYSLAKQISNTSAQDDIASLDMAKEASNLAQEEAAITASQTLFTRLSNLSLFNSL